MSWITATLGFLAPIIAAIKPVVSLIPSLFRTVMSSEFGRTCFWCVVVWLVMTWQGCGAANDAWDNGYAAGLEECVNDVRPAPDGDGGWYPGKNIRRWIFGTDRESPATVERYRASEGAPEVIDAPSD